MGTTTQSTVNKSSAIAGQKAQAKVYVKGPCIKEVPQADQSVIGSCNYYYRPYGVDPLGPTEVYKLKYVTIVDMALEIYSNPTISKDLYERLFKGKEKLIDIRDVNWSRWHDFKSRHRACGHEPPQYYINYGYYYCSRYGAYLYPSFRSQAGKDWLIKARKNLQNYLDDTLQQNMKGNQINVTSKVYPNKYKRVFDVTKQECELNNPIFKTVAFATHVPAYIDAGLAYVPPDDMFRIVLGPRLGEWMDAETRKQAWDAAVMVGGIYMDNLLRFVEENIKIIKRIYSDTEKAIELINILYERAVEFYESLEKFKQWKIW